MTNPSRFRAVDAGRRRAELTVEQLWLHAVGCGSYTGLLELEAYLHGLMPLDDAEQDVLAVAVNERLDELLTHSRVPLQTAVHAASMPDPVAVLEQLLATTPSASAAWLAPAVSNEPTSTPPMADGAMPKPDSAALSEALQRSLLTDPIQPDSLQIRVRYLPAAAGAQIGGDWYDAFLTSDEATCLVVGDVAGHDRNAAVGMAQVRNLLRGIAYTVAEPPGAVLRILDSALRDLAVGALATALLARVEQTDADLRAGVRRLRWSNAGHPPPLLLHPDGTARLLSTEPDLMLGVYPDVERAEHQQVLPDGATVLLYTDGLVERRGAAIDDGLTWLADAAGRLAGLPLDDLCDRLLAQVGGNADDDIALLALRTTDASDEQGGGRGR